MIDSKHIIQKNIIEEFEFIHLHAQLPLLIQLFF